MENAVIAMISIAIILGGTLTLALSCFPSVDMLSSSWKQMTQQAGEMRRTEIHGVDPAVLDGGSTIEMTIKNEGEVSLSDFSSWDVIVQYYSDNSSSYAKWLSYKSSTPLGDNQWTVEGIYFNDSAESIEPNILNPGEEMGIIMQVNPSVGDNTTNCATISTPSGTTARVIFQE